MGTTSQVKSMADALYEALSVSPHDLLDVVEGRIATLYRGIVAEGDAAKVYRSTPTFSVWDYLDVDCG
jgi:hypothetical protein